MAQDQNRVEQLLKQLVQPDTEKVKEATAVLAKEYSSSPSALLILMKILATDEKPDDIRQLASVEARKRVRKLWPKVDDDNKGAIRSKILEFSFTESNKLLRHSAAQIIAEIGSVDLENGQWTELPGLLLQAANSPEALHREMGLYIMLSLLESSPELFLSDVNNVVQVLHAKIQDPESGNVRLNALAIYAAISPLIDPEENAEALAAIQVSVPNMVEVLKSAIASGEEETSMKAFEYFQEILEGSPSVFQKSFADLIRFMLQVMSNKDIDADVRLQAVNFLAESVGLRRMRIQALKLGEEIALKALEVVVELDEFDDDGEGERNPATQCLALLDMLASNLPPNQAVLPVLKHVGTYANDNNPAVRRAGILALSMMVEGAPDFFATQLKEITPLVLRLLEDPDTTVRGAALKAVSRLAEDLADEFGVLHETMVPGIIKNFDLAVRSMSSATGKAQEDFTRILYDCCIAIDSMMDGMKKEDTQKYIDELVPRFSQLLREDNYKMKLCALSAIGAVAESAEDGFLPYFKEAMQGLGAYLNRKDNQEDLDLRRATTEALGKIALAVGPEAFKEYVQPLMQASEEGLHLESTELKEQSYILWSQLAKVYKEDFEPFLEGVVKGLIDCLAQEEESLLSDEAEATLAKVLAAMEKKSGSVKDPSIQAEIDKLLEGHEDEDDVELEDIEDLDESPASAIAMEKEIALEAMGDILSHTKAKFLPYFPQTIQTVLKLVEHIYSGMTQSAVGTLWRAYGTLWEIETDKGMEKWKAGIPLKVQPSNDLTQFGHVVMEATLNVWPSQEDRTVVSDINRMLADTLTLCGPAPLVGENVITEICKQVLSIITKEHLCQSDPFGDDGDDAGPAEESSEYDWLVIETAMDCLVAMSKAIGPDFAEAWKMFEKPVLKYASATDSNERSVATGTMAECILAMGNEVTPYTKSLMKIALHKIGDEDPVTKGNAIYAAGLLCQQSQETDYIRKQYNPILTKLEPLLANDTESHLLDNAGGCVARMIMGHPDKVPIDQVLPRLIELAPAKEDWEVNGPIFQCIAKLYQNGNPVIRQLTPQVIAAIKKVLSEPEDHMDDETRELVNQLVDYLKDKA